MSRVVRWRKAKKYTHQALLSDTLAALKETDIKPISHKQVVEVAEMLFLALRTALIERGQVVLKGSGTLLVNSNKDIRFIPTPEFLKDLTLTQLVSCTQPSETSDSHDERLTPHSVIEESLHPSKASP